MLNLKFFGGIWDRRGKSFQVKLIMMWKPTGDWWQECSSCWRAVRSFLYETISASLFILICFSLIFFYAIQSIETIKSPHLMSTVGCLPKCLRFLIVCGVLPHRGYFFASCCLVKTLAWSLRWVEECNSSLMGLPEAHNSCMSHRESYNPAVKQMNLTLWKYVTIFCNICFRNYFRPKVQHLDTELGIYHFKTGKVNPSVSLFSLK